MAAATGGTWEGATGDNSVYASGNPVAKAPPAAVLEKQQIKELTARFAMLHESAAARAAAEAAEAAAADARVAELLAQDPLAADCLGTAAPSVAQTKSPPG